jgi:hypothetical protein
MSSLVDASKSDVSKSDASKSDVSKSDVSKHEASKRIKIDMSVKEKPEKAVADARILKSLASYLWPKENPEFRRRVALALSLLVASKVQFDLNMLLGKCFTIKDKDESDRWYE